MNKTAVVLEDLVEKNDTIIVGVSGGPDSMMVLDILNKARKAYSLTLHAIHINHSIRGETAEAEGKFVEDWCRQQKIDCHIFVVDVPKIAHEEKLSLEEAGHRERFKLFNQLKIQLKADKLALGHHKNDRAETVLLHILKGCSPEGLAAMPAKDGWVIRPLIHLTKAEIIAYCHKEDLPYCLDQSNEEPLYLRNRLRLELLPQLRKEYNEQIDEALVRLAILSGEDKAYWQNEVQKQWQQRGGHDEQGYFLRLDGWENVPLSLKRRLIKHLYQLARPESQGLTFNQIEELLALSQKEAGYKTMALPQKVTAAKSYQCLYFVENTAAADTKGFCYHWSINEALFIPQLGMLFNSRFAETPMAYSNDFRTVVLDGEKLMGKNLTIRNRRAGDRFQPLGMKGQKKLKEYFIDRKIPQRLRGSIPLVFADDQLVWIVGYGVSEAFRVKKETKIFCQLTCFAKSRQDFSD